MNLEQLRRSMRSERTRVHDLAQVQVGEREAGGQFTVHYAGEATKEVSFPIVFTEKPIMTFGIETNGYDSFQHGHIGNVTVEVYDWITTDRPPASRLYRGARLMIVSDGPTIASFDVFWKAQGYGLSSMGVI